MAIDTAAKRYSALNFGAGDVLPLADGTIEQADRQTFLDLYGGILIIAVEVPPDDDDSDTSVTTRVDRDGATIRPPRVHVWHAVDSLRAADLHDADRTPLDRFEVRSDRSGRLPTTGRAVRLQLWASRAGEAYAVRALVLRYQPWADEAQDVAADTTARTDRDGATLEVPTWYCWSAANGLLRSELGTVGAGIQNRYRVRFDVTDDSVGRGLRLRLAGSSRAGEAGAVRWLRVGWTPAGDVRTRAAST